MKIVFDTNVILDAIGNREGYQQAQALIMAVASEKAEGIVTANSIMDIYYIYSKIVGDKEARVAIWNILALFDIASVDGEDCASALNLPMGDFEDAILAVCASKENADFIVSRDEGLIASDGCPVTVRTPEQLFSLFEDN